MGEQFQAQHGGRTPPVARHGGGGGHNLAGATGRRLMQLSSRALPGSGTLQHTSLTGRPPGMPPLLATPASTLSHLHLAAFRSHGYRTVPFLPAPAPRFPLQLPPPRVIRTLFRSPSAADQPAGWHRGGAALPVAHNLGAPAADTQRRAARRRWAGDGGRLAGGTVGWNGVEGPGRGCGRGRGERQTPSALPHDDGGHRDGGGLGSGMGRGGRARGVGDGKGRGYVQTPSAVPHDGDCEGSGRMGCIMGGSTDTGTDTGRLTVASGAKICAAGREAKGGQGRGCVVQMVAGANGRDRSCGAVDRGCLTQR